MCGQWCKAVPCPQPCLPWGWAGLPEAAPSTGCVRMRKDGDATYTVVGWAGMQCGTHQGNLGCSSHGNRKEQYIFCGTVGNPTVAGQVGRDWSGRHQAHIPTALIPMISCAVKMSKAALITDLGKAYRVTEICLPPHGERSA